jgi:hypothetical protein
MLEAAGNIFRAVTVGEALESTGETALQAHRACNSIIEHAGLRAAIQRNGRAN